MHVCVYVCVCVRRNMYMHVYTYTDCTLQNGAVRIIPKLRLPPSSPAFLKSIISFLLQEEDGSYEFFFPVYNYF